MKFHKLIESNILLNPLLNFKEDSQAIEYRKDPLTGVWCRINVRRAERVKQAQAEITDLEEIIAKTRQKCFFCPENLERATPLFPPHICEKGRIRRGQCYLFPNLFPFAKYHAIATMTAEHFLDLDRFGVEMIVNNLEAAREFIFLVHRDNPAAKYPMYNWNHLPPSAASIVHPHVQILVDQKPTPYVRELMEMGDRYYREKGRNYWRELVAEEENLGERYIGHQGSVTVLASYAPQGNREVLFIFESSNLMDLDQGQVHDFAVCLEKILRGYKRMGVSSFNLTTFSGPVKEKLDYYTLHAKIISRPIFQPYYTNDTGFLERFHYEAVIEAKPEDVAKGLKLLFEG